MGILDEIGAVAGELGQNNQAQQAGVGPAQQAGIGAALIEAVEQHPGGVAGLLNRLRQNGMSEHVNSWAAGQQTPATPQQVQQGLNGTGLIEQTAQRAGVSHEVAASAVAALLPMVIHHFAPNGQAAPQSEFGGLAGQFLSRIL